MMVITTAAAEKGLPKVIVTLAGSEIDALLAGRAERFPVTIGETDYDVEMIAASQEPPAGKKPNVRLRVADGALRGARLGAVTVFFEGVPFQLVLMCSDPPPAGPVQIAPGLTYENVGGVGTYSAKPAKQTKPAKPAAEHARRPTRDEGELPLVQRLAIGAAIGGIVAMAGYLRDEPLYYLVAIGVTVWSIFGKTNPTRGA